MLLSKLISSLDLQPVVSGDDIEVTGGYVSDLMSDVLANAKSGNLWVTNQRHVNVVAVASLLGLSGVIVAGNAEPDENTVEKAQQEKVSLYKTTLSAFDVVGRLYELGVRAPK